MSEQPATGKTVQVGSNKKSTTKQFVKRVAAAVGLSLAVLLAGASIYVGRAVSACDESMAKVYDVPLPPIARSADPAVIARGDHLVHGMASCGTADCHGADLGGGRTLRMGPLGSFTGPNISSGGAGADYSDGEFARLIRHGIKRDGRSVQFMPVDDFRWLPDDEVAAIISYLRAAPASSKPSGVTHFTFVAKVLDRRDQFSLDVARRIDHAKAEAAPPTPAPTAEYGKFVANGCRGCHGEGLSGGPIPGAPPSLPIPLNLTPDASGLAGWTYEDFDRLLMTNMRRNGKKLNPFMPTDAKFDELEKHALWAYLQTLPAQRFGQR